MSDCSKNKNPLIRTGTSQRGRIRKMLNPGSVEIIDKSVEDWMVWAGRFSGHLNFFNNENKVSGSMQGFFTRSISANLALLSSYDPGILATEIREILYAIETGNSNFKDRITWLFDLILSYLRTMDEMYQILKSDEELGTLIENHIRSRIIPLEERTFAYYKASLAGTPAKKLIIDTDVPEIHIFYKPVKSHDQCLGLGLSSMDGIRHPGSFEDYYTNIPADPSIFGGYSDVKNRVQYITQHNFFTGILDELVSSATFMKKTGRRYLQRYLNKWPNHSPDYSLFLSWLHLLETSKDHVNELTGRHLDFYYSDVLRLKRRGAQSDHAFLQLTLNKVTDSYALESGTRFIGPKDDDGNLILYESLRETVLNKAEIKYLSAVYFGDSSDDVASVTNRERLFAAPVVNSSDGLGEEIKSDIPSWHPMHIKEYRNGVLNDILMPRADVGFAVSSHYLRLSEGKRKIDLKLEFSNSRTLSTFDFEAHITTEKEWMLIEESAMTMDKNGSGKVTALNFAFEITADLPSVVAYNSEVHGGAYTCTEPVLRILLKHDDAELFPYKTLSQLNVSNIRIDTRVGEVNGSHNTEGLKNLELHNDASPINPSKPFQPWGMEPTVGNSFILGSEEIFRKKGAKIQLNFEWKDLPVEETGDIDKGAIDFDNASDPKYTPYHSDNGPEYAPRVAIEKLSRNKWDQVTDDQFVLSSSSKYDIGTKIALQVDLASSTHQNLFLEKEDQWTRFDASSNKGYLRLRLKNDFGHRDYYQALQSFFKLGNDADPAPTYPYQPTLASFSVSYEAETLSNLQSTGTTVFENRDIEFFHVGPFGEGEQHQYLSGTPVSLLTSLLEDDAGTYHSQGSLFIGFDQLKPGDTQSVLFQVQEGSEDPLLEKPEEHLVWYYLDSGDQWQELDEDAVDDTTSGLIESGLIHFTIPEDAGTRSTIMESGIIWIRCSVQKAPDALCKILGIHPNTLEVERILTDKKTTGSLVTGAGEIKKLLTANTKIKKIEQPYSSFGGQGIEQKNKYYQRSSERLRHKDRAITIWDYEQLVLEAYPEIYKVKCLNHTRIGGSLSEGNLIYNEIAPGHVSVITIPNLSERNDTDPLKPYTKKSTLNSIKEFLEDRSSCHVNIHTAQPDFEEVKVKCTIWLHKEYTDVNYYKGVIQEALLQYLSPWAFEDQAELEFGGSIHESVLIDFIEELPYVDYLKDFKLTHILSNGEIRDVKEVVASTARSVLVSVPADEHDLEVKNHVSRTQQSDCNDE